MRLKILATPTLNQYCIIIYTQGKHQNKTTPKQTEHCSKFPNKMAFWYKEEETLLTKIQRYNLMVLLIVAFAFALGGFLLYRRRKNEPSYSDTAYTVDDLMEELTTQVKRKKAKK